MLRSVTILDFALLREVNLDLHPGLTVITGESGAGKSLLFDAIGFALGGRSHRTLLAEGAQQCEVELCIELSEKDTQCLATPLQPGVNTLTRRLHASGRTRLTINGNQASLEIAQSVAEKLFEIAGQFESRVLFDPSSHLTLLDEFGGEGLVNASAEYSVYFRKLTELNTRLNAAKASTASRAQEVDFLTYQIKELDKAAVNTGEATDISAELRLVENAQQLQTSAGMAAKLLTGEEDSGGAYDLAAQAQAQIDSLCQLLEGTSVGGIEPDELAGQLTSVLAMLDDAGSQCRYLAESIQVNPEEAQRMRDRLDLLHNLERKYGVSVDELPELLETKKTRLILLTDEQESPEALEKSVTEARRKVLEQGAKVTKLRKQAVKTLVKTTHEYFSKLSFPQVELRVELEPLEEPATSGCDYVELMITLNPGEPARPLAQVASGGEASRLMLGLKAALAERRGAAILLLDEIEAGLGGQAAESVAQVLGELADKHQVLAISHLPVVAANASQHIIAEKQVSDGRTSVNLKQGDAGTRKEELMRMVGGAGSRETAALADKLLTQAIRK